jgi:hypothetical protein
MTEIDLKFKIKLLVLIKLNIVYLKNFICSSSACTKVGEKVIQPFEILNYLLL